MARVEKGVLKEIRHCGSVRLLLEYNCFLPQAERWVGRLWRLRCLLQCLSYYYMKRPYCQLSIQLNCSKSRGLMLL